MADKLRTTYPLKIKFYEGEQPTALKLSAISSQSKSGLHIIEKAIGDLWGNGGDTNSTGLQIPNLGRVLGENRYLNPVVYSLYQDIPFYYIENLNDRFNGETTGYLRFVPHNRLGGGYEIKFGDTSGADVGASYFSVGNENEAVDHATRINYWIDSKNGGTTGKFRFGAPITGTLFVGYWVNPADWDLGQEDIVPGVIPDPRGIGSIPGGGSLYNYIGAPILGGTKTHTMTLPFRAPLTSSGTGYTKKLPFQLPTQALHGNFDLNSDQGKAAHSAFGPTLLPRLWSYVAPTPTAYVDFYRYRLPLVENLNSGDKIPDGTLYLCYGDDHEIIEGLEFYRGTNGYTIEIDDKAGLLAAKILIVDDTPEEWRIISCNPSVTKRLWALDQSFSHHTHDGTHGDHPFDNLNVDGTVDAGLVVANWGDDSTSGFTFDNEPDSKKSGIQLHELGTDANPAYGLTLNSQNHVYLNLDTNNPASTIGSGSFVINECRSNNTLFNEVFSVDQTGFTKVGGDLSVEGNSIWLKGYGSNTAPRMRLHHSGNHAYSDWETGNHYWRYDETAKLTLDSTGNLTAVGKVDAPYFSADTGVTTLDGYTFDVAISGGSDPDPSLLGLQYDESNYKLIINTPNDFVINLDTNGGGSNKFAINDGSDVEIFTVEETGDVTATGKVDAAQFIASVGDGVGTGYTFDTFDDSHQMGMQLHNAGGDVNPTYGLTLNSQNNVYVNLDTNHDGTGAGSAFVINSVEAGPNYTNRFLVWENGNVEVKGNIDVVDVIASGKVDADYLTVDDGLTATQGYGFSTLDPSSLGFQYDASGYKLVLNTPNDLVVNLDTNGGGTNKFAINDGSNAEVFKVEENGNVTVTGTLITGTSMVFEKEVRIADISVGSSIANGNTAQLSLAASGNFVSYETPGFINAVGGITFDYQRSGGSTWNNFPEYHGIGSFNQGGGSTFAGSNNFSRSNWADSIKLSSYRDVFVMLDANGPNGGPSGSNPGVFQVSKNGGTDGVNPTVQDLLTVDTLGNTTIGTTTGLFQGSLGPRGGIAAPTAANLLRICNGNANEYWTIQMKDVGAGGGANGECLAFAYQADNMTVDTESFNGGYLRSGGSGTTVPNSPHVGQITFTGQHRNTPDEVLSLENHLGYIVVSTGEYNNLSLSDTTEININEALPKVKLSTQRNQKSVFGVISDREDDNERFHESGNFISSFIKEVLDERFIINSLGEGGIWVCNMNGPLFNGDYITSCEAPGLGMLQADDFLHNYTVAKITCDCSFDLNSTVYKCEEFQFNGDTYKKAFVGCTYHCG